jgi:hypothetical protein
MLENVFYLFTSVHISQIILHALFALLSAWLCQIYCDMTSEGRNSPLLDNRSLGMYPWQRKTEALLRN